MAPILTRDFTREKKRNIVKLKGMAKTLIFLLSVLRRLTPVGLIRTSTKLFIITIVKRDTMLKTVLSPKPMPPQITSN